MASSSKVGIACLKNWELPSHFHRDSISGAGEAAGVRVNAGVLKERPEGIASGWDNVKSELIAENGVIATKAYE